MIKITQQYQRQKVKTYSNSINQKHTQVVKKTVVYLLFIPIFIRMEVIKGGM